MLSAIANEKPKVAGGGNCFEKGAPEVLESLRKSMKDRDLGDHIYARSGPCQRNCLDGVSMQVIPGLKQYSRMQEDDLAKWLEQSLPCSE
mgnify:CR=1 FL=1